MFQFRLHPFDVLVQIELSGTGKALPVKMSAEKRKSRY